jgi:hypothetical protein
MKQIKDIEAVKNYIGYTFINHISGEICELFNIRKDKVAIYPLKNNKEYKILYILAEDFIRDWRC